VMAICLVNRYRTTLHQSMKGIAEDPVTRDRDQACGF